MKKILSIFLFSMLMISMAMATDTAITAVSTLSGQNSYVTATALASWQAVPTSTNTAYIAYNGAYNYFVLVNCTSVGTTPKFNVLAGHNPPAFRSSLGNLAISLTANQTRLIGPLESARFLNETGYLKVSTTNVTTGTMWIVKVAK